MRALALALMLLGWPAVAAPLAKDLFSAADTPSPQAPAPIGGYAKGCLAGGVELPETAPAWQAVRLSRNRNWAHPEAVAFLERLGPRAQAAGWPRMLIGDISQPRGGPMADGHASHQMGLDIDIWFRPGTVDPLDRRAREGMGSVSMVAPDRRRTQGWTDAHTALLRAAAEDPATARIFVNAAIKRQLCGTAPAPRDWLAAVRPWWGHDSHFHVRLACPAGAQGCEDQAPVPPGEGCDASLDWWFSDEALNPPPPATPPVRARDVLTLADLPPACRIVIDAR